MNNENPINNPDKLARIEDYPNLMDFYRRTKMARHVNIVVETNLTEEELIETINDALEDEDITVNVIQVAPEFDEEEDNG